MPAVGYCAYNYWSGLQVNQPYPGYIYDANNGNSLSTGPWWAYMNSANSTVTESACGGWASFSSPPTCWAIDCELTDFANNTLIPAFESYIIDPAETFYKRIEKLATTNPITDPGGFFEQLGEVAAIGVASSLGLGPAFVDAAGDSDFFSSPSAFLNQLEQTGRVYAAQTIETGATAAQVLLNETGVGEVLAGGDLLIQLTAQALQSVGAPNAVVQAILYGRALTNGINALGTCSSEAAAGDTPPSTGSISGAAELGEGATVAKAVQRYDEPTALKALATSVQAGVPISEAAASYAKKLGAQFDDNKLSFVLGQVQVLHDYDGANVNWTPDDYANCLAANTYSLG